MNGIEILTSTTKGYIFIFFKKDALGRGRLQKTKAVGAVRA